MSNIALAFDGNPKTVWRCPRGGKAAIKLTFKDYVRIEKLNYIQLHLDGGNYYPYGYRNNQIISLINNGLVMIMLLIHMEKIIP